MASDNVAGRAELERAILALTDGQLVRLRAYARWRVRALGDRCADRSHEDLLSEALAAAIEGRRRWYPERVEFLGFLFGAMKSIVDGWGKRARPFERLESVETPSEPGSCRGPSAGHALADGPSPEAALIERQRKEAVLRLFSDDPVVTLIVCELDEGVSLKEIRTKYGLEHLEYKAALKRIRRRLARTADGGNHG